MAHPVITSSVETRSPLARSAIGSRVGLAGRARRLIFVCSALVVSTVGGLTMSSDAPAATPCAKAIVADWFDNGRIDHLYRLSCYGEAIDAIPPEIRDYSDAEDVIRRAFQAASGRKLKARTPQGPVHGSSSPRVPVVVTSSPDAIPIPLLALAGLAATTLVAGGLAYVSRRRHERRD